VFTPDDTVDYSASSNSLSVTVNPAALSISATAQSKTYGTAWSPGTTAFSVGSGLVAPQTVTGVTLTPSGGTAVTDPVSGSPYTITPSAAVGAGGFLAANYAISYLPGVLTVNPLPVELAGARAYDATTNAAFSVLSVTNRVGVDDVSVATGTGGLAGAQAGTNALTSVGTLALGGTSAVNYTLTGAGGAVVVAPLPVVLTGTRAYDGTATAPASILTVSNNLDGANLTLSGLAALAGASAGWQSLSDFTGLTLGGPAAADYTLTNASGSVLITNSFHTFSITSSHIDSSGTNWVVCWQSVPGAVYSVLTNASLKIAPTSWAAAGGPVTATGLTTCLTLPGPFLRKTNMFVVIKQY